ncbi:MAG: hypothetical protein ABI188_06345 [Collimonas sp.]|uniref:hypothetical protein n=1 Tax=Collimonas sp. TaxID=1963772 RepID=UPI0032671AD9
MNLIAGSVVALHNDLGTPVFALISDLTAEACAGYVDLINAKLSDLSIKVNCLGELKSVAGVKNKSTLTNKKRCQRPCISIHEGLDRLYSQFELEIEE